MEAYFRTSGLSKNTDVVLVMFSEILPDVLLESTNGALWLENDGNAVLKKVEMIQSLAVFLCSYTMTMALAKSVDEGIDMELSSSR